MAQPRPCPHTDSRQLLSLDRSGDLFLQSCKEKSSPKRHLLFGQTRTTPPGFSKSLRDNRLPFPLDFHPPLSACTPGHTRLQTSGNRCLKKLAVIHHRNSDPERLA